MRIHAIAFLALFLSRSSLAFFEVAPLLELVSGQIQELERLAKVIGVAEEQRELLFQINEGIDRTIYQIQSIQSIIERAQGLDPSAVKSLSDLTNLLEDAKNLKTDVEDLMIVKLMITKQAVDQSALQSQTAYQMGQEMIAAGAMYSKEASHASPGRAAQISASGQSAQVLAKGVELQTLAQISQTQALILDFQKQQLEEKLQNRQLQRSFFESQIKKEGKEK